MTDSIIVNSQKRAKLSVEKWARYMLFISACFSIAVTILIISSVFFESLRFFQKIPISEFLFGTQWSPQISMRAEQGSGGGAFGVIPVLLGTILITIIAILVATPIGLSSAIYLTVYASKNIRNRIKPIIEILAGIPTVVYGYFAIIVVAPFLRSVGEHINQFLANLAIKTNLSFLSQIDFTISSESALGAGLVMGIMIIPFIMSLSDDVINSVPTALKDGSLALGATPSETVKNVIIPAAFPGIISSVLLGVSRAIGETMIVVMAAGLSANLTINPLSSVTTITVQIVTLLTGDQEFDSSKTLAAFALGLLLFIITLILNIIALVIVKRFKEQYD